MFSRQKLLKHLYTKTLHILFSFLCVKYINFSFGFNDVFDSKHKNVSQHARTTSLVGK